MSPINSTPEGILINRVLVSLIGVALISILGYFAISINSITNSITSFEAKLVSQARIQALEVAVARQDMLARITSVENKNQDIIDLAEINRSSLRTIWPRLRVHGENISLLKREIEAAHPDLDIELNAPEPL